MPLKTILHDEHVALGAKMGEFAGYDMPLYYKEGVLKEHEWVRSNAGFFDVSHMGQIILKGPGVVELLELLTPSDFYSKPHGRAQYTVLTNEDGGIIDDLIVTRLSDDEFFIVLNAGCKEKDIAWIRKHISGRIELDYMEDRVLLALQGPKAEQALDETLDCDVSNLPYMHIMGAQSPCGTDIFISRLGYTGEDGFELSMPFDLAKRAWNGFLKHDLVKPAGLAARDSLRLEMGYCLYGHDIDGNTSPVEADLSWVIGKDNTGFIGADRILAEKKNGASRKRVGIKLIDKGIAREGSEIFDEQGNKIGVLTSGGPSPSLKASIGQGYVPIDYAKAGEKVFVEVRGRKLASQVVNMPFIEPRTKSMKKKDAA